jgi:hypothetical protein
MNSNRQTVKEGFRAFCERVAVACYPASDAAVSLPAMTDNSETIALFVPIELRTLAQSITSKVSKAKTTTPEQSPRQYPIQSM